MTGGKNTPPPRWTVDDILDALDASLGPPPAGTVCGKTVRTPQGSDMCRRPWGHEGDHAVADEVTK